MMNQASKSKCCQALERSESISKQQLHGDLRMAHAVKNQYKCRLRVEQASFAAAEAVLQVRCSCRQHKGKRGVL